jgi:hypothetical protein
VAGDVDLDALRDEPATFFPDASAKFLCHIPGSAIHCITGGRCEPRCFVYAESNPDLGAKNSLFLEPVRQFPDFFF